MLKKIKQFIIVLLTAVLSSNAVLAITANTDDELLCPGDFCDPALELGSINLRDAVMNIINIFLGFLGLISILIILIGIYKRIKYRHDKEKSKKAIKLIKIGLIGVVILLVLYIIAFWSTTQVIGPGADYDSMMEKPKKTKKMFIERY